MRLTAPIHGSRATSAEEILGREHPLAHAEERVGRLGAQSGTVAVVLVGSAAGLAAGARGLLAVLVAAAIVQTALAILLASAVACRHERALALIAAGRERLPLDAVRRERARLADPRRATLLARSLERLRSEARRPYGGHPIGGPLYEPGVIREVDGELGGIVRALRAAPRLVAVARAELLLRGPSSPLYGTDSRRLREELRRIQFTA
jgi:hypothetical protein